MRKTRGLTGQRLGIMRLFFIISIMVLSAGLVPAWGEEALDAYEIAPPTEADYERLNRVRADLNEMIGKQEALKKELAKSSDEDKEELEQAFNQARQNKREYQKLFEQLSLGNIDTARFNQPKTSEAPLTETYNWQNEVLKILQPVFAELRRITEQTWHKDTLKEEEKELKERLVILDAGIEYLEALNPELLSKEALASIKEFDREWKDKKKNLEHELNIVQHHLSEYVDDRNFMVKVSQNSWDFMKGRGLTIMTAIGVSVGLYYFVSYTFGAMIRRYERKKWRTTSFSFRLFLLVTQLVTFLVSLVSFLMILHSSGDMVLFGFAVLILFTLLVTFRNTIPAYIRKLRLFLNLGQVREGERLIYNGLPWKVDRIHLYGIFLSNPRLDNGELRLPVDAVDKLQSRPIKNDEIWYPSSVGDSLVLPDGKVVKVIRQTPEAIYLDHQGSHIIYPTMEFMNLKARNISLGYSRSVSFSIECDPLSVTPKKVSETLCRAIQTRLKEAYPDISLSERRIKVHLKQIVGGKVMHFTVMFDMPVQTEKLYFEMPSIVQEAIIGSAQNEQWTLLTIDMAV